jgi:hypothetical protein
LLVLIKWGEDAQAGSTKGRGCGSTNGRGCVSMTRLIRRGCGSRLDRKGEDAPGRARLTGEELEALGGDLFRGATK